MNLKTQRYFLMTILAFSLALTAGLSSAQVYKTVDENGNVIYTDQPPADGAKEMELPPLSVIEVPVYQKTPREVAEDAAAAGGQVNEIPLRTLRKNYKGFKIASPQAEESIWHPEGPVPVVWSSDRALQDGMKVTLFVDGDPHSTTSQAIIPVVGLERGEHTLTAEIKDARNRTIATAEPVVFFIRQPGLSVRRVAVPRGGG